MHPKDIRLVIAGALLVASQAGSLRAQTEDYLNAPNVKSIIRLEAADTKIRWSIPGRQTVPLDLPDQKLFVTPSNVTVTFVQLNPLATAVKGTSKTAADPGAATMNTLVTTLLS